MRNRRARVVLTLLLLTAFTLITLDFRSGSLGGVRKVASSVFGPIEHVVDDVVHPIGSWFSSIGHLGSYKSENKKLHQQVAQLETKLRLTSREQQEYQQAKQLLHLSGLAQYTIVAAQVTAESSDLGFGTSVTINRGSANGIAVDETVINAAGLVGRVTNVGRTSATVELANTEGFIVGCRLSSGIVGEIGQVTANGPGNAMTLQTFNNRTKLTVGEQLVTLGAGGRGNPFVSEVPIGTITAVEPLDGALEQTATVKPYVDFGSLDLLAVVVNAPATIKHDSLLPAKPTPAPTVTVTITATPGSTSTTGTTGTSTSPTTSTSP
jgi:rod shape-determining protein MreC